MAQKISISGFAGGARSNTPTKSSNSTSKSPRQTHAISVVNINSTFIGGVPTRVSKVPPRSNPFRPPSVASSRPGSSLTRCSSPTRPSSTTFPTRTSAYLAQRTSVATLNRGKVYLQEHPGERYPRTPIPSPRITSTPIPREDQPPNEEENIEVKKIDGVDWLADYKRHRVIMKTSMINPPKLPRSYPKMMEYVRKQRANVHRLPTAQPVLQVTGSVTPDPVEAWVSTTSSSNGSVARFEQEQEQEQVIEEHDEEEVEQVFPDFDPDAYHRPLTTTPVASELWSSEDEGIELGLAEEDEDKVCYGGGDYSEGTGQLLKYYLRQERGEQLRKRQGRGMARSAQSAPVGGRGPVVVPSARSNSPHRPHPHRPTTACCHHHPHHPQSSSSSTHEPQKQAYTRVGGYYLGRKPENPNRAPNAAKFSSYVQIHRPIAITSKGNVPLPGRSGSPTRGRQPISVPAVTFHATQTNGGRQEGPRRDNSVGRSDGRASVTSKGRGNTSSIGGASTATGYASSTGGKHNSSGLPVHISTVGRSGARPMTSHHRRRGATRHSVT